MASPSVAGVELASAAVRIVVGHRESGRFRVTGTVPGGGEFEMVFEVVAAVRTGRTARLELLPEGQVDEAIHRLAKALE